MNRNLFCLLLVFLVGCATQEKQFHNQALSPRNVPYEVATQNREGYKVNGPVASIRGSSYVYSEIDEGVEHVRIGKKMDVYFDERGHITEMLEVLAESHRQYVHIYHEDLLITSVQKSWRTDMPNQVPHTYVSKNYYNEKGDLIKSKSPTSCILFGYKADIVFKKPCLGNRVYTRSRRSENGHVLEESNLSGHEVEVLWHGEEYIENGQLTYLAKSFRNGQLVLESKTVWNENDIVTRQEIKRTSELSKDMTETFSKDRLANRELVSVEYDEYQNPIRMEYKAIETDWAKGKAGRRYVDIRDYTYY